VVGPFQVDFKNIATALQGIRLAQKRLHRPVRLIRVSQFPLSDKEMDIVTPDSYHFHVPYPKMGDFYRKADLFISMSKEAEGFGLPAIEAMSCGTPTILSNISSYTNFDTSTDYALFVDPDDPQTLADAIVVLAGDRSLRKALIHKGLRVAAQFNRESFRDRLIEAFNAILQPSSVPRTPTL
jgi:glycosyltransferase involved in cell wall biosynthesis